MIGRLRPGFTKADAKAELLTIMSRQDRAYVERKISAFNRRTSLVLTNGSFIENPAAHTNVIGLMALILGPLSLILLLACSNVTMLFLSRTIARSSEIAVRVTLGAGRSRLAGMLLVESLFIVSIGGALSVILAYRVPLLIMNIADPSEANTAVFRPDWQVFGYLAVLVAAATVISSLMPIRAAWKLDLITALKGREGAATVRSRTTNGLIVVQIALSFVLTCAAVMFGRIPGLIRGVNPGFETHQIVAVPLDVDTSPSNRDKAIVFYRTLESKILAIPGAQSLTYASLQPFSQAPPSEIRLLGQAKGSGWPASVDDVSSSFFSAFDIRALQGRIFSATDVNATRADLVAVISQAFAKQFWPDNDPLGKVVVMPDDRHLTVLGVVADTRSERFGALDGPRIYTLRDPSEVGGNLYVRFAGSAMPLENAIRDTVKGMDPTLIVTPETMWESLEAGAESLTSLAKIILIMASIALLMAVTGVYSVLSFSMNQRRREFGIKMVLGASRVSIFRSVLFHTTKNIGAGLICGFALAEPALLLFNQLLAHSPLPINRFDLTVFSSSALLLTTVSLIALYLPAYRATHTDPMRVLRTE
jgi:predicted permease